MSGAFWGADGTRRMPARTTIRWGGCFLLVVLMHAGALVWLRKTVPDAGPAMQDAVMLDLAPEPTAPPPPAAEASPHVPTPAQPTERTMPDPRPRPVVPTDQMPPDQAVDEPPAVTPAEPEPSPVPPQSAPPVQQADVALPPKPRPPRARPVAPNRTPSTRTPAASAASPPAPIDAPAGPGASALPGRAEATWQARLVAHLARFKRFPPAAERRGEQGTVMMRFTMARDGTVIAMSMAQGSGYADLDQEARAWIARAQPLPPLPTEITAAQMEMVVPLRFLLR